MQKLREKNRMSAGNKEEFWVKVRKVSDRRRKMNLIVAADKNWGIGKETNFW